MGRHAFAEGLLSLLSVVAVIGGLLGLVGAAVLWQGSSQAAFGLAVGSLVGTATVLALCQVGLVVVDIAESGRRSAEALVEIAAAERAQRAPEPARPAPSVTSAVPAPQAVSASPAGDARRWQFLKDSDEEVAAAAGRMAALGPRWEAAMAERVLELGAGHLAGVERFIRAKAEAKPSRRRSAKRSRRRTWISSPRRRVTSFWPIGRRSRRATALTRTPPPGSRPSSPMTGAGPTSGAA